jgi:2,3-bisphosphoglycerate-dependent phosphoglycerate mutase
MGEDDDATAAEPREYRQERFRPPPGSCEFVLVRHGESAPARDDEPFPLVDGHGDPPLAPEGRQQAELLGERLSGERVDAIYVTSLRRTHETAAPLADRLALTPSVEADLREVHLGEWEGGLMRRKVAEGDPLALRMWNEGRWDVIPGAESHEELGARVLPAVQRIADAHPDQRVVVVVHGGVIATIMAAATGGRPFAFIGADNASISHLVVHRQRWTLRRFNDTGHLDAPLTTGAAPLV